MSTTHPNSKSTPADLDLLATRLLGGALERPAELTHITAVGRGPDGQLHTLLINEHSPKSELDWSVLHLARARADAIFTTGKILRDEPNLQYEIVQPKWARALLRWRNERWRRATPPCLVVLTSGKAFNKKHPALHGWPRPLIFTNDRAASRALSGSGFTVISDDKPSLPRAISHCRIHMACRALLIETGPSTANTLYDPLEVDELWLSEFTGPLPEGARGAPFISVKQLRSRFTFHSSADHEDVSGTWTFHRFAR